MKNDEAKLAWFITIICLIPWWWLTLGVFPAILITVTLGLIMRAIL